MIKFEFGLENSMKFKFGVPPSVPIRTFKTTWKTDNVGPSNDDQIALPLVSGGSYNFDVDWGDGNTDTITAWDQAEKTHTYSSSGTYNVEITGTIQGFAFANALDKLKLLSVEEWGPLDFGNFASAFYGCTNLNSTATDAPVVGNTLDSYFRSCSNFNGPINKWDVSSAASLSSTFLGATSFNQNISGWDVSSSTNFENTFNTATVFNQDISMWDVGLGILFNGMFLNADAFDQDIGSWDMSSATSIVSMLRSIPFDQDISGWDITSVTGAAAFLDGSTLSTANYDALLIGWEAQAVQDTVTFDGGSSTYSVGAAATARAALIADHSWSISDGGPA